MKGFPRLLGGELSPAHLYVRGGRRREEYVIMSPSFWQTLSLWRAGWTVRGMIFSDKTVLVI